MHRRCLAVVPLAAIVAAAAGCGSSSGHAASSSTLVPASGTLPHSGTVPTVPASTTTTVAVTTTTAPGQVATGSSPSTVVTVPGSGTYVLSAKARAGSGPCVTPGLGGSDVPFTVSVTNQGSSSESLARVAVAIEDPKAGSVKPVAALQFSGLCSNFTEPGNTLGAGQTMTYDGAASGVSSAAVLQVTVISTPANDTLGEINIPLG